MGFLVFFEILLQERWLCHVVSCDTLCFAAKLFAFSWRTAFIYFLGTDRLGGHLKFTLLLAGILYHDQESRLELIVAFVLRWEKAISRLGV